MFIGFYWLIEVRGWKRAAFPLVVVGMNSIFIYSFSELLHRWLDRGSGRVHVPLQLHGYVCTGCAIDCRIAGHVVSVLLALQAKDFHQAVNAL